jgi:glyoxylase-like metal-dependent hydrolase (beta-lactamase superfamily II)
VVAGETVRIELPTPFRVGTVNVFLLEGSPLTLIDSGPLWPRSLAALERGLAEHGHRIEDIELVVLTHQHCDHVGLAGQIRARAGATIAALPQLADFVASWTESIAAEDAFAVGVMRHYGTEEDRIEAIRRISESYWGYAEAVQVDQLIADGDEIEAGGRALRVLTRPGHSPTDTMLVEEATGMAFTGDHLLTRISTNPVIHRPAGGSMDPADREATLVRYLDSLRRTAALGLTEMMPGHGDPRGEPNELIELRIGLHEERKEKLAELIEGGRVTVPALADALWGQVEASQIYLAVSEVLGHTDLLIGEGRLREREQDGMVVFEPVRPTEVAA